MTVKTHRISTGVAVFSVLLFAGCSRITPPAGVPSIERVMDVTGYCPCGECCGWKRNWLFRPVYSSGPNKGKRKVIGLTASGVKAHHGTIAADTSIYPFGTVMYVEGYGYGRVEDRGGDIKGNKLDLYFSSHSKAARWGRKKMKVLIWKQSGKKK